MSEKQLMMMMLSRIGLKTNVRVIDCEVDGNKGTAESKSYEGELHELLDLYRDTFSRIEGEMHISTEIEFGRVVLVIRRNHMKGENANER